MKIRVLRVIEHEFRDEQDYVIWQTRNHFVPLNGSRVTGPVIMRSATLDPSFVKDTEHAE